MRKENLFFIKKFWSIFSILFIFFFCWTCFKLLLQAQGQNKCIQFQRWNKIGKGTLNPILGKQENKKPMRFPEQLRKFCSSEYGFLDSNKGTAFGKNIYILEFVLANTTGVGRHLFVTGHKEKFCFPQGCISGHWAVGGCTKWSL